MLHIFKRNHDIFNIWIQERIPEICMTPRLQTDKNIRLYLNCKALPYVLSYALKYQFEMTFVGGGHMLQHKSI